MIKEFLGWLFKKNITEEKINLRLRELIEDIKKYKLRCDKCDSFQEGCKAQDFEAISIIIDELLQISPVETTATIKKCMITKSLQPSAIIDFGIGTSMYPTSNEGDIHILNNFIELNMGDIIVCIKQGEPSSIIMHRIIGKDNNFYYTRGDNNKDILEKINPNTIVGKITAIIKKETQPEIYNFLYEKIAKKEGGERK